MRIAIVSNEVAPFFGAGIGTYAAAMARAWRASGHDLHLVSAAHPGFMEQGPGLLGGATCHTASPDFVRDCEPGTFPFLRHAIGVYRLLKLLHRESPFDYIEFPDYWAEGYFSIRAKRTLGEFQSAVLGVRLHTPTFECRELNNETWLNEETATLEHCEEAAIREADVVISPSHSLLHILKRRLDLTNPSSVVPYPFEPLTSAAHNPTARPTILYFGRLERRKGVELLIDVAQELLADGLDIDVRLIGGDTSTAPSATSMRGHLARKIHASWKQRITIQNAIPRHELAPLIASVAAGGGVACFPSLWENFPNTCLEAMSLGCPVVGSDAGGMAEIIEQGGLTFESGNRASLKAALLRLLQSSELRKSASLAGPLRIATLTNPAQAVERMIAAILSVPLREAAIPRPSSSPTVSFIVPFYNLSAYLPATLKSIQRQSFKDFETIVVNDGSTEPDAAPLLSRIEAGEFGPIRVIHRANGGLGAARNTGIEAARGRWVVPLDADDLLDPEFLKCALTAAARDPGLRMITSIVLSFDDGGKLPDGLWIPIGLDRDILATRNCASSCTALIERALLLELDGYDVSLPSFEDWDLYCRLALRGTPMTVIPEPLIRYRQREGSMRREVGERRMEAFHARFAARYPDLPLHSDRSMRILLARGAAHTTVENRAKEIIDGNIRYRVVDKVNIALKRSGVHSAMKGLASRIFKPRTEKKG